MVKDTFKYDREYLGLLAGREEKARLYLEHPEECPEIIGTLNYSFPAVWGTISRQCIPKRIS